MHRAIANLLYSGELSSVLCSVLEVWGEAGGGREGGPKERGYMYTFS